ncbi:MAG: hypothetical protein GY725_00160 [bacterium]|nr:hypothetical protein [bacterium]
MRILLGLVVSIGLAVAAFYGAVILASESGEVVTLRTMNAQGVREPTRLWVVDHDGAEWVRTGHKGKGWFVRVVANSDVELERAGQNSLRRAVVVEDPSVFPGVNRAFSEKYGAADWIVALSGDASKRVPVRLDPAL